MRNLQAALFGGAFLAIAAVSGAQAQAWLVVDLPDFDNGTLVAGPINGNNTLIGLYSPTSGGTKSFIRTADGTLTTFAVGDGLYTQAIGLNAADDVAGSMTDNTNEYGFLRKADGTVTTFLVPDSQGTMATCINDSDTIAGQYYSSSFVVTGFVRAADGTIKTFGAPDGGNLAVNAINNKGAIAGTYGGGGNKHGFLRGFGGKMTGFDIPGGSQSVTVASLTNGGVIAGDFADTNGNSHGYIRQADGTFVIFDDPDSTQNYAGTKVSGMNDDGILVGTWRGNGPGTHGYARSPSGDFVTLDAPGSARGMQMSAVGPNGKMTGWYTDGTGNRHLVRANAALTGF